MGENKGFSKNDMERVGLFQEMGYTTISDRYKSPWASTQFNTAAGKGKQMLPGGSKTRSALQAGYFTDKFNRIMENEAYSDPIKLRRQHRLKEGQKNIAKTFLPSSGEKKMSGLGSHYGTLAGPIGAFSPQNRAKTAQKSSGKNFYTNPAKKGTGAGYVGVTISVYHKHSTDEFDRGKEIIRRENDAHRKSLQGGAFKLKMHPKTYFDENPYRSDRPQPPSKRTDSKGPEVKPFKPSSPGKHPAGMKAGTFDPYPSHSNEPYRHKLERAINIVNKSGKTFMPSAGPKSEPLPSIMERNIIKNVNLDNHKAVTCVMSY